MGTRVVNVVGTLLLGLALPLFENLAWSAELRTTVTIGLLGAFTTYSTFTYEAVALLEGGEWGRGAAYMGGTLFLGFSGLLVGMVLGTLILQVRG